MIERWLCLGALLALLVVSPKPLAAAGREQHRCGFAPHGLPVTHMTAGVPLALAGTGIPGPAALRVSSRRERLLERERTCAERYPETMRYLRSILDRLIKGSHLEAFAHSAPGIELVLSCSRSIPLPVARATAGKVLMVPRALPARAGSEDAIAAVLGHEIAHLTLRHPEQFISATTGPTRLTRAEARALKQAHEREADIAGMRLAVNAGYDAHAAVDHLHMVDELAAQLKRAGRKPRRKRPPVHDGPEVRTQHLKSQIDACGYARAAERTPVASAVIAELSKSR